MKDRVVDDSALPTFIPSGEYLIDLGLFSKLKNDQAFPAFLIDVKVYAKLAKKSYTAF